MQKTLSCSLFLAIAASILFACGGPSGGAAAPATPEAPKAPAAAPGGGPKAIPHGIAGEEDCVSCHKVGSGPGAMPADHEGRASAACTGCHQAAAK